MPDEHKARSFVKYFVHFWVNIHEYKIESLAKYFRPQVLVKVINWEYVLS